MTARSILIIEDEHALGTALSFLVRRMGNLPVLVASGASGLAAFDEAETAAVVLDIGLPDMSGLEVLEKLRSKRPDVPILVITAHATLDHAIHAQKSGATGYLTKPLDLQRFEQTLGAMLASGVPKAEKLPEIDPDRTATIIGAAPCLRDAFLGIARACSGEVPALIHGPSGSGKSLATSVIHAHSAQSGQELRTLACTAIRDWSEDFESPGTLVLDEITALAPALQSRLATWLAGSREIRPRVLATTARDPHEAMQSGELREDLFYALSALVIPLPPLRDRSGDIPALSEYFIGLRGGVCSPVFTPAALAALQAYPWPGNVRELRHVIDCALAVCNGGAVYLSHLPPHVAAASTAHGEAAPATGELDAALARWLDARLAAPECDLPTYDALTEQIETIILRHLLERHHQRPTRLANALRIHRATLRQKLRRLGLQGEEG